MTMQNTDKMSNMMVSSHDQHLSQCMDAPNYSTKLAKVDRSTEHKYRER